MAPRRYRELSFTRRSGETDTMLADTEIVIDEDGKSFYMVRSKTNPLYVVPIPMEGDPAAVASKVLAERRAMAKYDADRAPGVAIAKPVAVATKTPCPACRGEGECEDKHGNWKPCRQCGGTGEV